MKLIAIGIGLAVTILIGLSALTHRDTSNDWYQSQQQQQQINTAAKLQPAYVIGGYILFVGLPLVAIGALVVALYRFFRRPMLIRPDAAGRLALDVRSAQYTGVAAGALEQWHATQQVAAQPIQPVPYTYSPHISTTHSPTHSTTHNPHYAPHYDRPELPSVVAGNSVLSLEDALAGTASLPERALLADYIDQVKPHCLAFGIDTHGRLLQAPLSQSYHLLSSGRTRSGKSNSLNLILAQLHYQQRHHGLKASISVLDYKRELSAIWSRSALVSLSTTDPSDMMDLLRGFVHGADGLLARQDLFDREGQRRGRVFGNLADYERGTGEQLQRHFIAIDELNAVLIAADTKQLGNELAQLLYLGAGSGFFVVGGAHSLDANTFRRAAKEQFSSRLQFGPFDQSAVNLMYGSIKVEASDVTLLDGHAGRGLIQLVSQSRPTPFQSLQVEESDLLPFIDQRPALADLDTMQRLIAEADAVASQSFAPDAPISDALRRNIWAKKRAGLSKEATIRALWNVGKSGKGIYPEMARLYDRVLGLGEPETATEQAGV